MTDSFTGAGPFSGRLCAARPRRRLYPVVFVLVGLLSIGTAGCARRIDILQVSPLTHHPAATLVQREHAIAVLGVDYDPPLSGTEVDPAVLESGVMLLVAVANQGSAAESDVAVSARLLAEDDVLLDASDVLETMPPGEVRLVRFKTGTSIPRRDRYQLHVMARPVPGEVDVADNQRTYEIVLRPGS